jgi:DNA-directed RNA polymerase specialized sigma24 family protein
VSFFTRRNFGIIYGGSIRYGHWLELLPQKNSALKCCRYRSNDMTTEELTEIWSQERSTLVDMCSSICGHRRAEDVVQKTWLRMIENGTVAGIGSRYHATMTLYQSAKRLALNAKRDEQIAYSKMKITNWLNSSSDAEPMTCGGISLDDALELDRARLSLGGGNEFAKMSHLQ